MGNEIENIFLNDKGNNNLNSLSPNITEPVNTTIISKNGIVKDQRMFLFNGQIISTNKNYDTKVIKFEQLNVDLSKFNTTTIKQPKIQETSTIQLLSCFISLKKEKKICSNDFKKRNNTST